MVLRSQTLFSLYCCVSLLATQAAYAKTVEIGAGDTRIIHLSKTGKASTYKRYNKRRRVRRSRAAQPATTNDNGAMAASVQISETASSRPSQRSASRHNKKGKNQIAVVTPMKLKLSTTPAIAQKATPKTAPKPVSASPVTGSASLALKQTAPAQKVAALTANKKAVSAAPDPTDPQGIYEQYIKEIKAGKGFENVMPVYASEKKKANIAKLLSSPKSKKFAIGFIEAAAKCTAHTFIDEKIDGKKATIRYSGIDTCTKENPAKLTETVTMVKENGSWKIDMISSKMTDVVKIDVTKPMAR